jgi:hypothetical protein
MPQVILVGSEKSSKLNVDRLMIRQQQGFTSFHWCFS